MHLSLPKWFPLFILASSVFRSLQCLISTLTQGGEGGHLFRLTCSVVVWGREEHCKQISVMCVGSVHSLGHTGFAPAHGMCAFLVYTAQVPGCSAGVFSQVGPGLHALPRSKPLRFRFLCTPQRCSVLFVPFPVPSSSGDQVLGEHTLLRWRVHPITSLVPDALFPG